jgi:hypothetical protein
MRSNIKHLRWIIFWLMLLGIGYEGHGQNWTYGLTMSPFSFTRAQFDRDFLIIGKESFRIKPEVTGRFEVGPLFVMKIFNHSWFLKYQPRNWFARAELGFIDEYYRFRSNDEFDDSENAYFNYTSINIPISGGYQIGRGRRMRLSFEGGPMLELGKSSFGTLWSWLPPLFGKKTINLFSLFQDSDDPIPRVITERKNNVIVFGFLGLGVSSFGTEFQIRYKTSLTSPQKHVSPYNSNFVRLEVIEFQMRFSFFSIRRKIPVLNTLSE